MHVSWRSVRDHTAAVFAGFTTSSFLAHLILFFIYFSSRPRVPNTALGQVHPLNNHGSFVYVSQSEATGLSLLMIALSCLGPERGGDYRKDICGYAADAVCPSESCV